MAVYPLTQINQQVMSKLVTATPSSELVDAYLTEIAKAYSVSWSPRSETESQASQDKVRVRRYSIWFVRFLKISSGV
jgi:hypothetical protein